jgi:hypothetical protein
MRAVFAMKLLDLLRAHWSIGGLDAPKFAWIAAAGLLVIPLCVLIRLYWKVRRESKNLSEAAGKVDRLRSRTPVDPRRGLPNATYNELVEIFGKSPSLTHAWNGYTSLIVARRAGSGQDEFWASESADCTFTDSAVLESRLNRSFYNSLPSIVTGTGLLFTFLAILVALVDVRITQTNQIEGLPLLIEGLSGKFVSSIAALLSATIFLLAEKPLAHRLSKTRLRLISSIDALVPRLSSARVLADIQRDIAEQTATFRSFNADLATKLRQGFSESMGPTIQRMVETIEELDRHLRAAETQKQDSITGSVSSLLQNLEGSITSSLQVMGDRFKDSLSGTATSEFARVTESLGGTAHLLATMNAQFQGTQSALEQLVTLAKNSTAEQLALGKSQVEDLTAVLRQFMVQMNESAGASVSRMAATLTGVVHDLSTKVNDLGAQMAAALEKSAEQTTNAASTVVEKADKWSARSAEQLEQLMQQLQTHTKNAKEVEDGLMAAFGLFNDSLSQYASLNSALNKIASEANAMASAMVGAARSTSESQKALQQVSAHTTSQLERLAEANKRQQEVWASIHNSMEQYKNAFTQTERAARELLGQIAKHVDSHLELTKKGYGDIVRIADEHFAQATQRLGASVNELDEKLVDLTEALENVKVRTDGNRA